MMHLHSRSGGSAWLPFATMLMAGLALVLFHVTTLSTPFSASDEGMTVNYAVYGHYQLFEHVPETLRPFSSVYAYSLQPFWMFGLHQACALMHIGTGPSRLLSVLFGVGTLTAFALLCWKQERRLDLALCIMLFGFTSLFLHSSHTSRPETWIWGLSLLQWVGAWFYATPLVSIALGFLGGLSLGIHTTAAYLFVSTLLAVWAVQSNRAPMTRYLLWWAVGATAGAVVVLHIVKVDDVANFLSFASGPYHSLGKPLLLDSRFPLDVRFSKALVSIQTSHPFNLSTYQVYFVSALLSAVALSLRRWKALSAFQRFAVLNGVTLLGLFALLSPVTMEQNAYFLYAYPWLILTALQRVFSKDTFDLKDLTWMTAIFSTVLLNRIVLTHWPLILFFLILTLRGLKHSVSRAAFWCLTVGGLIGLALTDAAISFQPYMRYLVMQRPAFTLGMTATALTGVYLFKRPYPWAIRSFIALPLCLSVLNIIPCLRWDAIQKKRAEAEMHRIPVNTLAGPLIVEPTLWLAYPRSDMQCITPLWIARRLGYRLNPVKVLQTYGRHLQLVVSPDALRMIKESLDPQKVVLREAFSPCEFYCLAFFDVKS